MLTRYERMVAFRYLRPVKGEGSIFFIVSIGVLTVAVGVAALIAVMSIMNGFRAELFDKILSLNGHAIIQGYDNRLPEWRWSPPAWRAGGSKACWCAAWS